MRRFFPCLAVLVFALSFSGAVLSADCNFVASKGSDKYHSADCGTAKNIKEENKTCYQYPEEATQAGLTPCGICKPQEHTKVVSSKKSDKYHLPECGTAKNIKPENLVNFESPEDAIKAGHKTPCGVCNPPKAVEKKEETQKSQE